MKPRIIIALLTLALAACAPTLTTPAANATDVQDTAISIVWTDIALTQTAMPTPIPTIVFPTPSPLPTQPVIPIITPNQIQVERWQEYEEALGEKFLGKDPNVDEIICEWEILGQSEQEIYVWAKCKSTHPIKGSDLFPFSSMPAVINLEVNGAVQGIEIPGAGTLYAPDIRKAFPPDVQDRIFNNLINYRQMSDHLEWRLTHPEEPPLVVLSATSTP